MKSKWGQMFLPVKKILLDGLYKSLAYYSPLGGSEVVDWKPSLCHFSLPKVAFSRKSLDTDQVQTIELAFHIFRFEEAFSLGTLANSLKARFCSKPALLLCFQLFSGEKKMLPSFHKYWYVILIWGFLY